MSVVLPTPDAGLVARFAAGDENALVALYREEYDSLLGAAVERLGHELTHFRGRVAHKAMLDAWQARERFQNPVAFSAFLEEAVRQEADIQKRKHAALHHREGQTKHHVTVPTAEEAVKQLIDELHAPEADHAQAAEEARALKRTHTKEHVERIAPRSRWMLYTGISALVIGAIALGQRFVDRASSESAVTRGLAAENAQNLSSGRGQRGTLTLRDDTKVRMGSDTRLIIPAAFASNQRTVQIEGAATFTVAPADATKPGTAVPFAVRAGSVTFTAKGTVFTVRNYTEDESITLEVTEGTVEAKDRTSGVTQAVSAGEAVRFAGGAFAPLAGVARDVAMAWTRDSIVFDNAPLKTVVPELVRWFAMNAKLVDESAAERPVSMRIALNSSGEATKALTEAANLAITFGKDDRIEFTAAPPAPVTKKK
jgi:transmembrane sensor